MLNPSSSSTFKLFQIILLCNCRLGNIWRSKIVNILFLNNLSTLLLRIILFCIKDMCCTSHGSCWPLPRVVPCSCLTLCVRMICGSSTGGMCWFSCGYMLFVTDYVWTWIMTMEIDFVCLTSDSLTTFAPY